MQSRNLNNSINVDTFTILGNLWSLLIVAFYFLEIATFVVFLRTLEIEEN